MTSLCVVEQCAIPHRHRPDCHDDNCGGCLPRLATDDSLVCERDWTATVNGLRELPGLYVDLLCPTRAGSAGPRVSGSTEKRLPMNDGPRQAREAIDAVLAEWARVLEGLRYTPTGVTVDSRAAFIRAHAPLLLKHPEHADQLVADVRTLVRNGRRCAYPSSPAGQSMGTCPVVVEGETCGTPLRARGDQQTVTCPGCGTTDTPAGFLIRATPEAAQPMTTGELIAWLGKVARTQPTEEQVWQWASRGHIQKLGKVGREQTYDPVAVLVHVRSRRMVG